ncbi:MAG: hypothetical protein ACKOTB_02230 [Planctomycetia bacterium]
MVWTGRRSVDPAAVLLAAGACLMALGCGRPLEPVGGTVTFDGKPVTGGSVAFLPVSKGPDGKGARPGSGTVQSGGEYRLGSYAAGDGVAVGTYRVTYSPPVMEYPPGVYSPGKPPPLSGFENLVPSKAEVEIKAGGGTIDIELVKPAKGG